MADVQREIESRLQAAVGTAVGPEHEAVDPLVRPAGDPKFGDYQANLAMGLAKRLGQKPRDLAKAIVERLDRRALIDQAEVAGPGFINLTLADHALNQAAASLLADRRLGVPALDEPRTLVVDYSSPNVAKQMHVGHLRSTIIGDCLARVLEFQGWTVIRQNHLGDWGTQFGMLIERLLDEGFDPAGESLSPDRLTALYQQAKERFDSDSDFADRARRRVVSLQQSDEQTLALWRALVDASKQYFNRVYRRLGVRLTDEDVRGESFYNDRLAGIVNRLDREGHLHESQGAKVVYPEGFVNGEGQPQPMIVRKTDGGYLYATTDLAAATFRVNELGADRILYVIGLPQRQHFEMFTTMLRQAHWVDQRVRLDFVGFGSVLGAGGKMFKTRSGQTIGLEDLLDEARSRAARIITEKNPELDQTQRDQTAETVGIGALKYADLSNDRVKDYQFNWDRMLAFDGNTAPYLQNAYVRIRSIFRKGEVDPQTLDPRAISAKQPAERVLVLGLLRFPDVLGQVGEHLEPHRLCTYLYELAGTYHRFYEKCPVLKADDQPTRQSRLALSAAVAKVLAKGLDLLGIGVVERM